MSGHLGRLANLFNLGNRELAGFLKSRNAAALAAIVPVGNNTSLRPILSAQQGAIKELHPLTRSLQDKLDAINPQHDKMVISRNRLYRDDMTHICNYIQAHLNIK
jgi:hypothetical protein